MAIFTTTDGTEIFFKDWGTGQPIFFHHGWPLSADDWDAQMMFFLGHGYRVIAHDRRGHGRSTQTVIGNDMDTYASDVDELVTELGLTNAIHVGHSTGGGEVIRYVAQHGKGRVAKAAITTAQMRASGATAQLSVNLLRRNVFMVSGSGGNVLVLPGKNGMLAVDSGFATSEIQMRKSFASISEDPLKYLVDGNKWMHAAGATIIAHSKTLDRMSHRQVIPEFEGIYPPSPAGALPTVLDIHENAFPEMLLAIPSMAQRCVYILLDRVRDFMAADLGAENLVRLESWLPICHTNSRIQPRLRRELRSK